MTVVSMISHFTPFRQLRNVLSRRPNRHSPRAMRLNLHQLAQDVAALPPFIRESPVAMRYLHLLGPLAWDQFPERNLDEPRGHPAVPYAAFAAAYLVKLDIGFPYMSQLRQYLVEHPALMWVLGFSLVPSPHYPWGFDPDAGLPTQRHFTRLLRTMPNQIPQFLLDSVVGLLQAELVTVTDDFGQAVSLDTKPA
jgi:hypothetical protein